MKLLFYTILFITFFTSLHLDIKSQDIIRIDEVIKFETRQSAYKNSNEEFIDSTIKALYKNAPIDELLAIQTSSQIKSYGGLGNLSTIILRGSGANQVSVNWNGFSINSVTSGITDLSLIQSGFFESIKIIPGASSSLYGSGTSGGAVELNNFSDTQSGLSLSAGSELGSFETKKYFIQSNFSNKYFQYHLSLNKTVAKNDFSYIDIYKFDKPLEKRKHNSLKSLNLIQTVKIKFSQSSFLESGLWYIIKDKEIPEIAGSYNSGNKMQSDSIFRTFLRWKKLNKKSIFTISSAYFSEALHYSDKINSNDTDYSVNSEIDAENLSGNVSYRYYLNKKLVVDFAGILNFKKVTTENYTNIQTDELNYTLLSAIKYNISDFDIRFSFRNEFSTQINYIPVFDLGIIKKIYKNRIILKSRISNKFRLPTFNEKYWPAGGNPDIKHEISKNTETSFKYLYTKKNNVNNIYFAGYYSKIKDMIQWIPKDGVWTAVNNKEVTIFGLESNLHYSLQKNNFTHSVIASYNYTNSKLTDDYSNDEFYEKVKSIYIPEHSVKIFLTSSYKKYNISYATQYYGKRYTSIDNNENSVLPSFFNVNIYASYKLKIKHFNIVFTTKFLNIFNTQYEMIKSYPSPGRAFYFGVVFTFKRPQSFKTHKH